MEGRKNQLHDHDPTIDQYWQFLGLVVGNDDLLKVF